MDPVDSRLQFAAWTTLSFLFGATGSLVAGYLGM
jgi:Na+/H+-translocating membrane pyrophosphatase